MRITDIITMILHWLTQIPTIVRIAFIIIVALLAIVGLIEEVFRRIPELAKDLFYKYLKKQDYRAKTTIVKVLIDEKVTQIIKVRIIRVLRELSKLELDPVPAQSPGPSAQDRLVTVTKCFSVPGRAHRELKGANRAQFLINLEENEKLHPGPLGGLLGGKDYSLVLSYTMEELRSVLYEEPFQEARQPVGSERLVIEVQFPPEWKLQDNTMPEVITVDLDGIERKKLGKPQAVVKPYPANPAVPDLDSRGPIDYILASVTKPPQRDNIRLKWAWEQRQQGRTLNCR